MGLAFVINEEFVAGKQYFAHDIAVFPEMSAGGLHAKVIETEEAAVAVILDDAVAAKRVFLTC